MLRPEQFQRLASIQDRPCISIYSPTGASGSEASGDPIRLKNGVQEAERRLVELGFDARATGPLLAPAREVLAELSPATYADGTLAMLLGGGAAEILHVPVRVEPQVFVSDRLHLKPLLPVLTENARFYVLAASQNAVHLLECDRFAERERSLAGTTTPTSLAAAVPASQPPEGLQARTTGSRPGGHEAMFHGYGPESQLRHHQLLRFLREVSEGIAPLLDGQSPLVFAGVDELFAIYREASAYEHVAQANISGNPEHVRPEELRARGWEIVSAAMEQRIADAHEAFGVLGARGRATDDVKAAVLAARDGLAGTIIGATDRVVWGRVSEDGTEVEYRAQPDPWDYDLIDYAALQVIAYSGTALMVPGERVPGNGHGLAALLRY